MDGSFNLHFVCEIFTEDDCDHPVTILCMVYDHPELGMIDYHPGMWMVYLNLHFVCKSFTEDDCEHPVIAVGYHTLYGMTIL